MKNTNKFQSQTFSRILVKSLETAKVIGHMQLNSFLYNALEWPSTSAEYVDFLSRYAKWTPQQSDDPAWRHPKTGQSQEVYMKICHFYWLIDQTVYDERLQRNIHLQNDSWFSKWLVDYVNLWGTFLDTEESFNDEILQSFIDFSPKYAVKDSMTHYPWRTFNEFFARKLNPGLRPIASPTDNKEGY